MSIIGRGTFGCVVSPAIVFASDDPLVVERRESFVTKFASNAPDEYQRAMKAASKMGPSFESYAVLPVGPLHCVKRSELESLTESIPGFNVECGPIVTKRTEGSADDPDTICGFQMPRFEKTLDDLVGPYDEVTHRNTRPLDFDQLWPLMQSLLQRLDDLHMKNVYHLDIKEANITADGLLLDWGLSRSPSTYTELDEAYDQVRRDEFLAYYEMLSDEFFNLAQRETLLNLSFNPRGFSIHDEGLYSYSNLAIQKLKDLKVPGPPSRLYRQSFLGLIDLICLAGLAVRSCRQSLTMARAFYEILVPYLRNPLPRGLPERVIKDPDYDSF